MVKHHTVTLSVHTIIHIMLRL